MKTVRRKIRSGKAPSFSGGDSRVTGGVFTLNLARVREILPSGYRPFVVAPGVALGTIVCRERLGSASSGNGTSVVVAVLLSRGARVLPEPFFTLHSLMKGMASAFVFRIAVSGRLRKRNGGGVPGKPEFAADIAFRETATHRILTVRDRATLELILELDFEKIVTREVSRVSARFYAVSAHGGSPSESPVIVTLRPREWGVAWFSPGLAVRWGRHASADPLKNLGWGWPILGVSSPRAESELGPGL